MLLLRRGPVWLMVCDHVGPLPGSFQAFHPLDPLCNGEGVLVRFAKEDRDLFFVESSSCFLSSHDAV